MAAQVGVLLQQLPQVRQRIALTRRRRRRSAALFAVGRQQPCGEHGQQEARGDNGIRHQRRDVGPVERKRHPCDPARDELRGERDRHGVFDVCVREITFDGHRTRHPLQRVQETDQQGRHQCRPDEAIKQAVAQQRAAEPHRIADHQHTARRTGRGDAADHQAQQHRDHHRRQQHPFGQQHVAGSLIDEIGEIDIAEHTGSYRGQVDCPQDGAHAPRMDRCTHRILMFLKSRRSQGRHGGWGCTALGTPHHADQLCNGKRCSRPSSNWYAARLSSAGVGLTRNAWPA